ncbi:hypothetical protein GIB67_028656 [Kingdonia uniflora]|uniref:Uncharacterized protein n=1 Tax=Kingdonia uniflora TaxID=39325 RepID=A0A7J7L1J2_9MAGN|nr:hypothetical protein GIB67_028656 [Kingdonia uniflora]
MYFASNCWSEICLEPVLPHPDRDTDLYHLDLCKNVFGEGIYPDVDATNIYYGGTNIAGTLLADLLSKALSQFTNTVKFEDGFNSMILGMKKRQPQCMMIKVTRDNDVSNEVVKESRCGEKISGSKIVFTNGSQDPWRHASKQTSSPDSEFSRWFFFFVQD